MYWYLTIRANDDYSHYAETTSLIEFLAKIPALQQIDRMAFSNTANYPWLSLIIAKCNSAGSYAQPPNTFSTDFNVVELICSNSSTGLKHVCFQKT